jgi:HTH-type transcriptional regulator/antitoxin MqsA
MNCLECANGKMELSTVCLVGERSGESFRVKLQGFRCPQCGFETVDSDQSAEFTRLVSDAYRTAHGLLTGREICSRRAQLGMTQLAFAEYLGTGVASVKRWETGKVQEKAMDELIRLKTDLEAARANLKSLERQMPEQFIVSEGKDITLVFASTEYGQYMQPHAMTVETFAIVNQDDLSLADSRVAA